MIYGYARVSTDDQNLLSQIYQLEAAGCDRIFQEKISGRRNDRPELLALLSVLGDGDLLVVSKLDRLGRNVVGLIELVNEIEKKGAGFKSLHEHIDTTGAMGRFIFQLTSALAELEVARLRERTNEGLAAARAEGRIGGRRRLLTQDQAENILELINRGGTRKDVAKACRVGTSTIDRVLAGTYFGQ
jgi:DNA invertase Pin-like site-specific DNA recombinase